MTMCMRCDPRGEIWSEIDRSRSLMASLSLCLRAGVFLPTGTTTKILICPGWKIPIVLVSQPETPVRPFVPGLATGTKGAASAHVAGKVPFFLHVFLFSILFLFQLYFCISIKLMYWNSVCMISTNIYIYSYLYNIWPR